MGEYEKTLQEIEEEDAKLRQRRAEVVRQETEKREQEEQELIEIYWYQRLVDNPEDPEALRAKAAIIDRKMGQVSTNGVSVKAETANINVIGNN